MLGRRFSCAGCGLLGRSFFQVAMSLQVRPGGRHVRVRSRQAHLDETLAARGYALKTRKAYRWALQQFDRFVGAEPLDGVGIERLVEYQRHLAIRGVSYPAFRVATCALRFFYRECLRRTSWDYTRIQFQ